VAAVDKQGEDDVCSHVLVTASIYQVKGRLDWRHSFMVGYSDHKADLVTRTSLVPHTDDR